MRSTYYFLITIVSLLFCSLEGYASHGTASVSDIDHRGMGTFSGSYTHSSSDHVWFVFRANAGDTICFSGSTGFTPYLFLYQSNDDSIRVGEHTGSGTDDMTLRAEYNLGVPESETSWSWGCQYYVVTQSGEYALQLDAYLGGSGSYSLTISGSSYSDICGYTAPLTISLTNPTGIMSNGSIEVNTAPSNIRFSRWTSKSGTNYPKPEDLDLENVPAGDYYLFTVINNECIRYYGPYTLSN